MKYRIYSLLMLAVYLFTSCNDVLDRPSITSAEDPTYWTSEEKVRLYANGFYSHLFKGYGVGYNTSGAPLLNYSFNDDRVIKNVQTQFLRSVPTGDQWAGDYTWVRKSLVMVDRIEERMKTILTPEQYNHWMGLARFFKGLEYANLVNQFGDVPYYEHVVANTDIEDLYKDRTPRNEVMDAVYDDFEFALENVRRNDGAQNINRYIVATLVSRWALYEGSWQKYYYNDTERAQKFFDLSVKAAEIVMNSGKFGIVTDFRTLFGSTDLTRNADCILYRKYNAEKGITHSVASNCNMNEPTDLGPNLDLIKSFICVDGKDWQTSTVENSKDFSLENLIKTRDSRFEASFYNKPTPMAKSCYLYITKFIPRHALDYLNEKDGSPAPEFKGDKNVTGYPVLRYSEVLLNWIEAKAELATIGGAAVTQDDIDKSINQIRNRPLAPEAVKQGVKATAPMQLSNLPNDPSRDPSVSALLWEIRRERRMEFAFEYSRLIDLKRWAKLEYMDTDAHQDLLVGAWVNFEQDVPGELKTANVGKLRVMDMKGNLIVYDGKNGNKMKGFFYPEENKGRLPFLNIPNVNPYLSPIGINQINDYSKKGYTLTQTEGWPATIN